MRTLRSTACIFSALILLGMMSSLPAQQALLSARASLTPGTYQEKNDQKGGVWNLQQNGVLNRPQSGQGMIGNGLMLFINNQQFQNYQPQATPDGELIMPGQGPLAGITVTRRMKLMEKEGIMRVVELLHNPGSSDSAITLEIRNNFNGRFSGYYTDTGRPTATNLQKGESGIIIIPQTPSHHAFLFSICSPKGKLRPTITQQNQYQINFGFPMTVPAGRTVAIAYTISQVVSPTRPENRWISKNLRDISIARNLKGLPREITSRILNTSGSGGDEAKRLAADPIDEIGIDRASRDILAMGETSRLLGTASCSAITIDSPLGSAEVPFEKIAALVGSQGGNSPSSRIFLRDGQIFSGNLQTENFQFVLTAGAKLEIDPTRLDRLVRSSVEGEGEWDDGAVAMILTTRGDRLAISGPAAAPLTCATPWGQLDFTLDDIRWISSTEDNSVGNRIQFKDGTLINGFLSGADLTLSHEIFGDVVLPPTSLRALLTRTAAKELLKDEPTAPSAPVGSTLTLSGNQRLVGRIIAPELTLLGATESIPVNPASIRRIEANESVDLLTGAPLFHIELWGGGVILAPFRDNAIPVEVRGQTWQVPVSALVEFNNPTPSVNEDARATISGLVRKLGSEDWETRESASQSLREFGYLARGLLTEALSVTPDPEVRHRLEQLLSALP